MVITLLLFAAVVLQGVTMLVLLVAARGARRKVAAFENTVRDFVTAPDRATPSPLAQTVDEAAQLIARAIIVQAKTTFMGEASAVSKAAAKGEADATMARFPWLAAISAIAPGFSKSLMKNPAMLSGIAQLLERNKGQGGLAPPANGNNGHRDISMPLKLDLGGGQ